jgi:hypothetical protein
LGLPQGRNKNIHLEDLGRQDNNIKVAVKRTGWMGIDWINLDQNKDKRWTFWNMVMNIQFWKMQGISPLAEKVSASQERLCSVDSKGEREY